MTPTGTVKLNIKNSLRDTIAQIILHATQLVDDIENVLKIGSTQHRWHEINAFKWASSYFQSSLFDEDCLELDLDSTTVLNRLHLKEKLNRGWKLLRQARKEELDHDNKGDRRSINKTGLYSQGQPSSENNERSQFMGGSTENTG